MRVLGFVSCHYMGDFARESLLSIKDFCDKVYVCHSQKPSHGFSTPLVCPDKSFAIRKLAEEVLGDKLIFESYESFLSEIAHREMRYKYSAGYSLILTCDLDEVFDQRHLSTALQTAYKGASRFYGINGYIHYWKTLEWYITDEAAPIRIENLTRDNLYADHVSVNMTVYHTSLCQREEIIRYKLACFGHRDEIRKGWLEEKYLAWTPDNWLEDLHPTLPGYWKAPLRFPQDQLPESLKNHQPYVQQKMRVLLIPLDYQRHTTNPELFTDMLNAFNRQTEAILYTDFKSAIEFKPDVIHFQGSVTPEELSDLRKRTGAFVVMWSGDARYAVQRSLLLYKEVVDAFFLPFSGKHLKVYESILGRPCQFIWEPIQDWRFRAPKLMDEGKVSFVGNYYETMPGAELRQDVLWLEKYVELDIRGTLGKRQPIPYEEVPDHYNDSYAVICENNYNDLDEYFTPRNLSAIAAGSCALMRYFPGIENHFQNLVHCVYYRNQYELLEWINFIKEDPHFRNRLASQGYQLALQNFSYDRWVETYLSILRTNFL